MPKPYLKNIYCLSLIKLSKWLMLIMPVITLFYNSNGLKEFDIYLLQAIYSLSVAILEIPSGYAADLIGRKKTILYGTILAAVGYLIYSLNSSFYGFLIAEIVLGIGGSFVSGADSALLFDTLNQADLKEKYLFFEGKITALGNAAETLAAIFGGMVAVLAGYRAVYIVQTVIAASAIPAALLLVEPVVHQHQPGRSLKTHFTDIVSVCRDSLFANSRLSACLLFSSIAGTATLCMAWNTQVYLVNNGFTEKTITPLWVILNLTVAVCAAGATQMQNIFGKKLLFLLIMLLIPGTYILLGILPLGLSIFFLWIFYALRGYATPIFKDLINQNCDIAHRATVLSLRSLLYRLGFAGLGPLIGHLAVTANLSIAFVFSGALLFAISTFLGYRLLRQVPEYFKKEKAREKR